MGFKRVVRQDCTLVVINVFLLKRDVGFWDRENNEIRDKIRTLCESISNRQTRPDVTIDS